MDTFGQRMVMDRDINGRREGNKYVHGREKETNENSLTEYLLAVIRQYRP